MNTYSPSPAPMSAPARSASAFGPLAIAQLVASGLIVLGAFGTWAAVEVTLGNTVIASTNIGGIDGPSDGLITLTLAVVAAALVLAGGFLGRGNGARAAGVSLWAIGPIICYTLAGAIAGYDWINVSRLVSIQGFVEINVGWGLMLTLAASIMGLVVSIIRMREA